MLVEDLVGRLEHGVNDTRLVFAGSTVLGMAHARPPSAPSVVEYTVRAISPAPKARLIVSTACWEVTFRILQRSCPWCVVRCLLRVACGVPREELRGWERGEPVAEEGCPLNGQQ